MSYIPQPGTVPHRVIAWLQRNHSDGATVATAVICEELGISPDGFATQMARARAAGLVYAHSNKGDGKKLCWGLDDGKPEPEECEPDEPLHRYHVPRAPKRAGELLPGVRTLPKFRALMWEGQLIATGMQMVDGAAVFTPEQVREIKAVAQ